MYSAYKLNKQGDNIQPWCTPFPVRNQSVVPCLVLTVDFLTCILIYQEAGQVVWYSHLLKNCPQFVVIHIKVCDILNKAEAGVFLELSCFFYDPADVGNLISGSSVFSKTSLNIWKFMVHVLLKPGLENFEHCFTTVWEECNCAVVWAFFGIVFGIGMKTDLSQSYGHCWVFLSCWHFECNTFTASSFRIWNTPLEFRHLH